MIIHLSKNSFFLHLAWLATHEPTPFCSVCHFDHNLPILSMVYAQSLNWGRHFEFSWLSVSRSIFSMHSYRIGCPQLLRVHKAAFPFCQNTVLWCLVSSLPKWTFWTLGYTNCIATGLLPGLKSWYCITASKSLHLIKIFPICIVGES